MKTIAIGADHAGFEFKEALKAYLKGEYEFKDFGTFSTESVDYSDYAHPVADAVAGGQYELGILLCGSGQGVCISANRHKGIRAALSWAPDIAEMARHHNNANILCIPARYVTQQQMQEIARAFLNTPFDGGRHERRVEKIDQIG